MVMTAEKRDARSREQKLMGELFIGDSIDLDGERDPFTQSLGRDLEMFEDGTLEFYYVDNLQYVEYGVGEDGTYERTGPASGRYDMSTRKVEVNSKYRGDKESTFAILAHELYHRFNPDEGNEAVAEYMAGKALLELSGKSKLAEESLYKWVDRQRDFANEYATRGEDWNQKMGAVASRYAEEPGSDPMQKLINRVFGPFKAGEKTGRGILKGMFRSYTTIDPVDAEPNFVNSIEGAANDVRAIYDKRKAAQKERAAEEGAREERNRRRRASANRPALNWEVQNAFNDLQAGIITREEYLNRSRTACRSYDEAA